ncbi:hypothetical protein EYF80_004059 [Liparis tanakae]|uniref:Uncharacterized protein n=1 Tax=Liparis tanakae TaxID=230148 RepID=A0A4Z2J8M7_9TELE|nr:hypothetical protein EYF80_004059 [Liparis tanakae]
MSLDIVYQEDELTLRIPAQVLDCIKVTRQHNPRPPLPLVECSMKSVSHDHGAVRTHLAAVETQSVATNLPHTHLIKDGSKDGSGSGRSWLVVAPPESELTEFLSHSLTVESDAEEATKIFESST